MARLFDRDKSVISRHIKNVMSEELSGEVVVAKFATTTEHGAMEGKTQTHNVDYYNLDMIISVGYRVKSQNGIAFRKWANKILKDYMIKGYAVNEKRLSVLEKTVQLLDIAKRGSERITGEEAKDILDIIASYSKALDLLDDYDHKTLKKVDGTESNCMITYEECKRIIETLRFNSESQIFAQERENNFESIIKDIYQSFSGIDLYPTIEEKAANFLYLTVKKSCIHRWQ